MKIRHYANGHWPEIVARIVGEQFTNQRKHHECPATGECGKGTPRFRFSDLNGNGHFFCHCSDGEKDGFDLLMCVNGYGFREACRDVESVIGECPKDKDDQEKPMSLADALRREVVKTDHSQYLASRGLEIAPGLDWARSVPYVSEGKEIGRFSAMLAPVERDGRFLTYHVTYLQSGAKAPVDPYRKLLPGPGNNGGACPLYEADKHMGIAEGVETAIAAKMLFGVPTWAALNTALMGNWEPPAIAEAVTIFADHDANFAGHAAAYKLAHRLAKKGLSVDVKFPQEPGMDWNDVLLSQREAA